MNGSRNATPACAVLLNILLESHPRSRFVHRDDCWWDLTLGSTEEKQKLYNAYGQLVGILNEEIQAGCSYRVFMG